jgi:predicted signal transduction protein with EAL and GGDEF domain
MNMNCNTPPENHGRGLNSIRVRFALMAVVTGILSCGLFAYVAIRAGASDIEGVGLLLMYAAAAAAVLLPAIAFYFASGMLVSKLEQLTQAAHEIASGELDTEIDVECQCDVGGLANSMRGMLQTLRSNLEENTNLAHFDQVSGLPNRLHLVDCLRERVVKAQTGNHTCGSIFFLDLNGFKKVNDSFGHEVGDRLLRAVSERLLGATQDGTIQSNRVNALDPELGCQAMVLARFGGDEFVMHVPDKVLTRDLTRIAEQIRFALGQPFDIDGRCITVGSSIGIARYPADADDGDTLLRNADLAMYAAKAAGANGFAFFEEGLLSAAIEHRELEVDLKRAIHSAQLEVYYQPKIDVATEAVCGAEALVRWNHPNRGLLGPVCFIEIAECTGMIVELGNHVLEKAIAQCAQFARQGQPLQVAINVSLAQLERPDFSTRVRELIRAAGAPPEFVTLEITESIASANLKGIRQQITPLRAMGVKFSIDDFGTGYSNLAKLLDLRFDELKIDRSLIQRINENRQHREAVRMIVALGESMGCKVLAEGIETPEQFDMVRKLGCDEVQGYMFAKPMPIVEWRRWEMNWRNRNRANREALTSATEVSLSATATQLLQRSA